MVADDAKGFVPVDNWEDVKPARPEHDKTFTITSSHISRASVDRGDLFGDPVSRALKEELNADWCMTGWGYATCGFPNNIRRSYSLWPFKELRDFFRKWQGNKPVFSGLVIHYSLDREYDRTIKPMKRKPVQNKSYAQIQADLK